MKRTELKNIFGKFYSPLHIVSSGKPLLISIGSRSIGKTTGWAIYLLYNFIVHMKEFIYCRRDDQELSKTCKDYFGDAVTILKRNGYNIKSFRYFRGEYLIDIGNGEVCCGYAIALSQESKYKSGHYSHVWWIVYDEFVAPDKTKYLGRNEYREYEYDCLIRLYQTVDRGIDRAYRNETRIICMGNNLKAYESAIMIGCGASEIVTDASKFINPKNEGWCLELTDTVEATKDIKNSFGFILSRDEQKRMNYENASDDNSEFIGKLTGPMKPLCNFKYRNHIMGVYAVLSAGYIYICNTPNDRNTIAMTCEDQTRVNRLMAESMEGIAFFETVRKAVLRGYAFYQDRKCRQEVLNYFRMI